MPQPSKLSDSSILYLWGKNALKEEKEKRALWHNEMPDEEMKAADSDYTQHLVAKAQQLRGYDQQSVTLHIEIMMSGKFKKRAHRAVLTRASMGNIEGFVYKDISSALKDIDDILNLKLEYEGPATSRGRADEIKKELYAKKKERKRQIDKEGWYAPSLDYAKKTERKKQIDKGGRYPPSLG